MYARVKQKGITINNVGMAIPEASYFVCDGVEDILFLPTDPKDASAGSVAVALDTGDVFMLSPSKKWVKFPGVATLN